MNTKNIVMVGDMKVTKIRVSVPLEKKIYSIMCENARLLGISLPTYIAMIIGKYLVDNKIITYVGEKINV